MPGGRCLIIVGAALLMLAIGSHPPEPPSAAQGGVDLGRQLSNPVASMISIPFQLNWELGADGDDPRTVLNFQPVLPIQLNEDWMIVPPG